MKKLMLLLLVSLVGCDSASTRSNREAERPPRFEYVETVVFSYNGDGFAREAEVYRDKETGVKYMILAQGSYAQTITRLWDE